MTYKKTNWTSTTPINTSNLNKIEDGIEQVDKFRIYSTEETIIGEYYGNLLYRKLLVFTTPSDINSPVVVAEHYVNDLLKCEGFIMQDQQIKLPLNFFYDTEHNTCFYYESGLFKLKVSNADYCNKTAYAMIEYTK